MAFGHFFWPGPKGQRPERPRKGKLQFGSATRLRLLTIAWVPDPQARDSRIPTSCLSVLVSEEAARVCALHDIGHTLIVRAYVHSWSRWVAGGSVWCFDHAVRALSHSSVRCVYLCQFVKVSNAAAKDPLRAIDTDSIRLHGKCRQP